MVKNVGVVFLVLQSFFVAHVKMKAEAVLRGL
jgi:hypothetical protein